MQIFFPYFQNGQAQTVLLQNSQSRSIPGISFLDQSNALFKQLGLRIFRTLRHWKWQLPQGQQLFYLASDQDEKIKDPAGLDLALILTIFQTLNSGSCKNWPEKLLVWGSVDLLGKLSPLPSLWGIFELMREKNIQVCVGNFEKIFELKNPQQSSLIHFQEQHFLHLSQVGFNQIQILFFQYSKHLTPKNSQLALEKKPDLDKKNSFANSAPFNPQAAEFFYRQQSLLVHYNDQTEFNEMNTWFQEQFAGMEKQAKNLEAVRSLSDNTLLRFKNLNLLQVIDFRFSSKTCNEFLAKKHWTYQSPIPRYLQFIQLSDEELKTLHKTNLLSAQQNRPILVLKPLCPLCLPQNESCLCNLYQRHQNQKNLKKWAAHFQKHYAWNELKTLWKIH